MDYFDEIKNKVQADRGFDLNQYTENFIRRRINLRLMQLGLPINSFKDYIEILDSSPEEYTELFDKFSINVTEFFRDEPVWEALREKILPAFLDKKKT